jgi:hypothetical protein
MIFNSMFAINLQSHTHTTPGPDLLLSHHLIPQAEILTNPNLQIAQHITTPELKLEGEHSSVYKPRQLFFKEIM